MQADMLLAEYLASQRPRPFKWGCHDCLTFTADWVARLTGGASPADAYRNKYTNALGAMRHIKRRGADGVFDIPDFIYPAQEIDPAYARAGDIVLFRDIEHGPALGLHDGTRGIFLREPSGFQAVAHKRLLKAWRVKN